MSAGVADMGQCIVLGVEDDEPAALAVLGQERCVDTVGVGCDLEAELREDLDKVVVGLDFFVGEFGVRMDLGRQVSTALLGLLL